MPNRPTITRLLCAAVVAAIMLPIGNFVFPYVEHMVGGLEFEAIEAVLSTTIGFGLYSLLFG